jgi:predicted PurR-regulated permease PerM
LTPVSRREARVEPGLYLTLVAAAITVLAIVGIVFVLRELVELVVILVIAVVLAEGLRPLVGAVRARGIPELAARAAVYVALLLALGALIAVLAQPVYVQGRGVVDDLPRYQDLIDRSTESIAQQLGIDVNPAALLGGSIGPIARAAVSAAAQAVRAVADTAAVIVLSFFWLSARGPLGDFVSELLPPEQRPSAERVAGEVSLAFAGYARGVALNMIVVGVVTGIAASILGLPAPLLLGVLAGLTEMIPIAGPIIGAVPAILLGLTISPIYALLVAGVYLVIQQVEAHTLVPLVMRQSVGLPALAVVLALAAGGTVAGVGGAIAAVPVAAALRIVVLQLLAPALRARHRAPTA